MSKALVGVIVFTLIEAVIMVGWLALELAGHRIAGIVVLVGGLFVEHFAAVNVGAGRPIFGPLPPDKL